MDFENLSVEEIAAAQAEKRAALDAILALDAPTIAQAEEGEALAADLADIKAHLAELASAEPAPADRMAALRSFASDEDEVEAAADPEDEEDDEEEATVEEDEAVAEDAPVEAQARVATLARRVPRPKAPQNSSPGVTITAAAGVPSITAGSEMDVPAVADGLVAQLKAFGKPSGKGGPRDLRYAGVAKFALAFPEELQVNRNSDDLKVIEYAGDESRLESARGKGSLVAAGGWCTPSENLYDLCEGETLDGLLSAPEIQVNRGGINFTKGPDFASFYDNEDLGFLQTEAEAIAGEDKVCFDIECPDWNDHRLDARGLCLMVPILTNAAFPELTQRTVRGALVAHAHKRNADILSRMTTIAGGAISAIDFGSSAHSTLANLEQITDVMRQSWRLGLEESMEVVLPFWVRGALRNDYALRGGRPLDAVTDAYMQSEFSARHLNVQYVYDWQGLPSEVGYPATFQALIYPAGTYVIGTSDVINLNAVYDHASLIENTYTGLFFEEGLLVANKCYDAHLVTIAVCGSGHTGVPETDVCGVGAGTSF